MFVTAREQTSITIDLDDVAEFDQELAEAIAENTRRYVQVCWLICCESRSGRIGINLPDPNIRILACRSRSVSMSTKLKDLLLFSRNFTSLAIVVNPDLTGFETFIWIRKNHSESRLVRIRNRFEIQLLWQTFCLLFLKVRYIYNIPQRQVTKKSPSSINQGFSYYFSWWNDPDSYLTDKDLGGSKTCGSSGPEHWLNTVILVVVYPYFIGNNPIPLNQNIGYWTQVNG